MYFYVNRWGVDAYKSKLIVQLQLFGNAELTTVSGSTWTQNVKYNIVFSEMKQKVVTGTPIQIRLCHRKTGIFLTPPQKKNLSSPQATVPAPKGMTLLVAQGITASLGKHLWRK